MGRLVVHQEKISDVQALMGICPFGSISSDDSGVSITASCKMCMICVRRSNGQITFEEGRRPSVDKTQWNGIAVYIEHDGCAIHPVSLELIGKARELADKIGHEVHAVIAGNQLDCIGEEISHFGVDRIFLYENPALAFFRAEPYTAAVEDYVKAVKPCVMLIGATPIGRSLAPRVAARLRTGLTADCTSLDIRENTDLIQVRPAFGGNIMAQIKTPDHRPQLATVRYKVMQEPVRMESSSGIIEKRSLEPTRLASGIEIISSRKKEKTIDLTEADVIVVAGRGVKSQKDLSLVERLGDSLNAQIASTRPLIEAGWIDPRRQIGLSGRTVKPKLIITCGVSGSVQFVAGMQNSSCIISLNEDEAAPVFNYAHLCAVCDIYEVLPLLSGMLEERAR